MLVWLRKMGGGCDTDDEVFYNFDGTKVTKLKVKIEQPGRYGLGYIDGDITKDKPTIIDWGNGNKTTLKAPIASTSQANSSTDWYTNYDNPGEYIISIDGWYNRFQCAGAIEHFIVQINEVLTEIIQVSSLITNFYSTFSGCKNLTSIPAGLFDKNTVVTSFQYTFESCSKLASIPSGLFDKNTSVTDFSQAFVSCFSLTGETPYTLAGDGITKIKLWDRDGTNGFAKPNSVSGAFRFCTGLTDYKDIPDGWK